MYSTRLQGLIVALGPSTRVEAGRANPRRSVRPGQAREASEPPSLENRATPLILAAWAWATWTHNEPPNAEASWPPARREGLTASASHACPSFTASPVLGTPSSETAIQDASAVSCDWRRLGNALHLQRNVTQAGPFIA